MGPRNLLMIASVSIIMVAILFLAFISIPSTNGNEAQNDTSRIISICGALDGNYESLTTDLGTVYLFTCGNTSKVTNSNFGIITEQNWTATMGRLTNAKQAYIAFIIMKHPEQLKVVIQNPSVVEVSNSANLPDNLYRTDITVAEQERGCQIYKELQFAELPTYDEFGSYYNIERVYRDGLNYFSEKAKLDYDGKIVAYEYNPIISCQ
ncbi:MAG: hypothetical protein JXA43_00065 [Candidatus Diapherotrites archaeon]|nr:hypothetical protein [Candidatus Diapherotrites archaeon]